MERIRVVQEALCGFLLDEVINPKREFHSDPRISVARPDQKKRRKNDAGSDPRISVARPEQKKCRKNDAGADDDEDD
jgi:hypothetical protein